MPDEFTPSYNRHFVRADMEGRVVKGFSDAFEEAQDGDICITTEGGRHFEMGGVVNPALMTGDGIPLYKVVEGALAVRTDAEIEADRAALPAPPPTLQERVGTLETDSVSIMEYASDNDYRICLLELGLTESDF